VATIAVWASSPLIRAGLAGLLDKMGFNPVEEAADIKELRQCLDNGTGPEILLVNLSHGMNPEISIDEVRAWTPITKIIILASDLDLGSLSRYFAAGASGYLLEKISADAFEECIRLVRAGEKVFPSELASLIPGLAPRSGSQAIETAELGKYRLSERELDILRCLAKGQSNKAIANTLNITESTVKVHVKRILEKTSASNRTQAALWGAARGLAGLNSDHYAAA
jgi:two-component system nitrate/nitrite response regulator NarL